MMENLRKFYWIYADISCAAYPLRNIDSIQADGNIDLNSAIHLLVNSVRFGSQLAEMIPCLSSWLKVVTPGGRGAFRAAGRLPCWLVEPKMEALRSFEVSVREQTKRPAEMSQLTTLDLTWLLGSIWEHWPFFFTSFWPPSPFCPNDSTSTTWTRQVASWPAINTPHSLPIVVVLIYIPQIPTDT